MNIILTHIYTHTHARAHTHTHTVLRSLGIPARAVTNFLSAHDTDANRSVDYYLDENYDVIPHLSSDSIW